MLTLSNFHNRFAIYVRRGVALVMFLAGALSISAQTNLAVLARAGAWTWFNDPRALFHKGKLYVGYVSASDRKTSLSTFDPSSGATTDLWNSGFRQLDDHNNPGLLSKQDGTLLAIY